MKIGLNKPKVHIGMRNVKTTIAIFLCLLLYKLIGRDNSFLACTTAIICIQDSVEKSLKSGFNRLYGTVIGAVLGMAFLYIQLLFAPWDTTIITASAGVMVLILLCNFANKNDSIIIGCVVFLVIVLNRIDVSPFVDSVNRFIDTLIGTIVAIVINHTIANPDKRAETEASDEEIDEKKQEEVPLTETSTLEEISNETNEQTTELQNSENNKTTD